MNDRPYGDGTAGAASQKVKRSKQLQMNVCLTYLDSLFVDLTF